MEPGHHDVDEDNTGLVFGYFRLGFEAVYGGDNLIICFLQYGLGGSADRVAVIDAITFRPSRLSIRFSARIII
jgi:hypothetical protein